MNIYLLCTIVAFVSCNLGILLAHLIINRKMKRIKNELTEYKLEFYKLRSQNTNMRKNSDVLSPVDRERVEAIKAKAIKGYNSDENRYRAE